MKQLVKQQDRDQTLMKTDLVIQLYNFHLLLKKYLWTLMKLQLNQHIHNLAHKDLPN